MTENIVPDGNVSVNPPGSYKDKVIRRWQRTQAEPTPPPHPCPSKDCKTCRIENTSRQPWSFLHGTVEDWLKTLKEKTSLTECMSWWDSCQSIIWNKEDDVKLCREYLIYTSNVQSLAIWGCTNGKGGYLSRFIPDKQRIPADEQWFKANAFKIP